MFYRDLKKNWSSIGPEVRDLFNITLVNERGVRGWKHGLIRRAPEKNCTENHLTTLRDISLLPCIYKLFMKAIVNRILPRERENILGYWQRAYLEKRDRQDLIFCLKTAVDDFRHKSSKFYALFIDFRDAFGSLKQSHMIKRLVNVELKRHIAESWPIFIRTRTSRLSVIRVLVKNST